MNKDVIYIESEDDITDIIAKIKSAKEQIVALVPPQKAGVLRSIVNIKLITKAAAASEKTAVLVTTDPSIIKLAAAVRMPVTKDLQSAPSIPENSDPVETTSSETISDHQATAEPSSDSEEPAEEATLVAQDENLNDSQDTDDAKDTAQPVKPTKSTNSTKPANKVKEFFIKYKKWCIAGAVALVCIIVVCIWAFVIAPAATITVSVRTSSNNFSENVTFTTKTEEESAASGKFYLTEKKLELPSKVEFKATGSKNVGEKATGEVVVYAYFKEAGKTNIDVNATFTHGNLTYVATAGGTLSWDYNGNEACVNRFEPTIATYGCLLETRIPVTAAEPGANYNIDPVSNGWSTSVSGAGIRTDKAITGGADKLVTVVSQADIDKAKESLTSVSEAENKTKLLEKVGESELVIESSFKQTASDVTPSPKVGEEVPEGTTPNITTTTTAIIYTIDKVKVEEFISAKAKLTNDQKIYSLGNPFIENFTSSDDSFTGKLKTSYSSGPKITESEILEKVKGRKIGEVSSILKSITGVNDVKTERSYFWVNSVPNDPNKITINLNIEE